MRPDLDLVVATGLVHRYPLRRHLPVMRRRRVTAVDGVDLHVCVDQTLAIVGESGPRKSTMMRIHQQVRQALDIHGFATVSERTTGVDAILAEVGLQGEGVP